jgi:hypothetical protein
VTIETATRELELVWALANAALDALASRIAFIDRAGGFVPPAEIIAHRRDKAFLEHARPTIAIGRTKTWRNR